MSKSSIQNLILKIREVDIIIFNNMILIFS